MSIFVNYLATVTKCFFVILTDVSLFFKTRKSIWNVKSEPVVLISPLSVGRHTHTHTCRKCRLFLYLCAQEINKFLNISWSRPFLKQTFLFRSKYVSRQVSIFVRCWFNECQQVHNIIFFTRTVALNDFLLIVIMNLYTYVSERVCECVIIFTTNEQGRCGS